MHTQITPSGRGAPARRIVGAVIAGALVSGALLFPAIANAFPDPQADTDRDGLPDVVETSGFNSDPYTPDGDGDGLNDLKEFGLGTNPKLSDSDGDGVNDGDEVLGQTVPMDPNSTPSFVRKRARVIAEQVVLYDVPGGEGTPSSRFTKGAVVIVTQQEGDWVKLLDGGWVQAEALSFD